MQIDQFNELPDRYLDVSGITRKQLDIAYASDSPRQRLDVYLPPEGEGPFPCVVFFHGGAYLKGDKRRYQLAPALTGINRGFAVVSVGYRLAPDAVWPAFVQDAALAVAYLHAHAAELGIDADRLALWGESAGAHLALQVGLTPAEHVRPAGSALTDADLAMRAIVDWYGPSDFEAGDEGDNVIATYRLPSGLTLRETAFGATGDELARRYREASLLTHLRHDHLPAVLIEHGLADVVDPISHSERLAAALADAGAEVVLRLVPGAKHGVADFSDDANLDFVFAFLTRVLS